MTTDYMWHGLEAPCYEVTKFKFKREARNDCFSCQVSEQIICSMLILN